MIKGKAILVILAALCVLIMHDAYAEEYYIITSANGSKIVVKSYRFTDEYVEYTTKNGLPGFMKKEDFVTISNMVGVQPEEKVQSQSIEEQKKKEIIFWIAAGVILLLVYMLFLVFVTKRKKAKGAESVDIFYGRTEKDPVTQGLLSFEYKEMLGKKQQRTVDVTSAYEEEGILYINGYCTVKNERKVFRADRVIGMATDMSNDRQALIEDFFVDAED